MTIPPKKFLQRKIANKEIPASSSPSKRNSCKYTEPKYGVKTIGQDVLSSTEKTILNIRTALPSNFSRFSPLRSILKNGIDHHEVEFL